MYSQAVLATPAGVVRLMDLVSDQHEAVRAEALPLLLALARASPDVQQAAAFGGAFERVLGMVREEGGPAGGVVVADGLALVAALVRGHAGTRMLFREGGHLAALPGLLAVEPGKKLGRQQAANLGAALELVSALVCAASVPGGSGGPAAAHERAACQEAVTACGGLQALLSMCLDNGGLQEDGVRVQVRLGRWELGGHGLPYYPPQNANSLTRPKTLKPPCITPSTHFQAMHILGELVDGAPGAQTALAAATINVVGRPLPVVQALLRTALRAPQAAEREAGDGVLASLCSGNAQVQEKLALTVTPVAPGARLFGRGRS